MNPGTLLRIGIIGSIVSSLFCFTKVLDELLAFLGLPSLLAYSNNLSALALALFLLLTMYGGIKKLELTSLNSGQGK